MKYKLTEEVANNLRDLIWAMEDYEFYVNDEPATDVIETMDGEYLLQYQNDTGSKLKIGDEVDITIYRIERCEVKFHDLVR